MTACLLAEVLLEAGMPKGLPERAARQWRGGALAAGRRPVRFFAFTGSTEVGRQIQQAAGLRRAQMELGSIACTILCEDARLDAALPKIVNAGYRKAGQVCTSVQLLLVHESLQAGWSPPGGHGAGPAVRRPERQQGLRRRDQRGRGHPHRGLDRGGRGLGRGTLAGGPRQGTVVPPTLLTRLRDDMRVSCSEIFGPVVCILPFQTLEQAIARVNATPFGLATGIFTHQLDEAFAAARQLEVGGVHVNETSSSRVDLMPYGAQDSGFGREGPATRCTR